MLRCLVPLLAIGCAMMGSTRTVYGQTPPPVAATAASSTTVPVAAAPHADSVAAMLPFARAHAALNALRERADAQYADPKNKKPEVLAELRSKYRVERERLLTAQGMTEASYVVLTQRISGDDSARLAFDAALAKIIAK
ncbi:hypothetical protein [Gemmatimonas sp.]|uniref:hypothetical protein n=1 Tax=Gemmatimonas sp. TaxID=1962908 RepID=UPI00398373F8